MAKKKEIITEDGHVFDSYEELYFYWWVKELMENGYIKSFTPQPDSFELSSGLSLPYIKRMKKVDNKELFYTLIQPSIYTTDAWIQWTEKGREIFYLDIEEIPLNHFDDNVCDDKSLFNLMISHGPECYIEVKPSFDQNNMTTLARTNIKWVWHNHKKFVNLVIPQKLFKKTFTPKRYLRTDKDTKKRVLKYKPLSLQEFVNKNENNQLSIM